MKECGTCNGEGGYSSQEEECVCPDCMGIGVDMDQLKSRCEYYGAEYECNKTTSDMMEYKNECASFFGKDHFSLLTKREKQLLNKHFKIGRDKERTA